MSVQHFLAEQIERMGLAFAEFICSTNAEVVEWKPMLPESAPTRSALELAGECIGVNRYFASLLRGETVEVPRGGMKGVTPQTGEAAQTELKSSSIELATAVRALSDEDFERNYEFWRGSVPGSKLVIGAYRNMAYHAGQVNLIQMLSGDGEFHMPSTWY